MALISTSIYSKKIRPHASFLLIKFENFPQRCIFTYKRQRKYPTHTFIQDHTIIRLLEYRVQGAVKDYNTITEIVSESSPAVDTVQDFLIKLDMKPCMHLVKISIFLLNRIIVRLTKIMNRADKNWAQF